MSLRFLVLWVVMLLPMGGRGADSVPAVAVLGESPATDPGPRFQVAFWPDGHVVWSRDQHRGGPPYWSAYINPRQIRALLDRFESEKVFEARDFRHSWFGPDSSFTTIWLQSGARHTRLQSWHEGFEEQPHLVALSTGVTSLNGRTREDALRSDTREYQQFRRVWGDLRKAIAALVPEKGEAYPDPVALKLPK